MKTLAIIGSHGMLGSDLVRYLGTKFHIISIHKENYHAHVGSSFDIVINANGNSKRFWANNHPVEDFIASTESVYKSIVDFKCEVYVYISSSDVYNDHTNPCNTGEKVVIVPDQLIPYGLHKYLSELLVRKYTKNYLILRSSMILGTILKKGPLYDVIHRIPLYVSKDSRLQIITTKAIAEIITTLLDKKVTREVINVGGVGTFAFRNLDKYVTGPHVFRKDAEKQRYEMDVEKLQNMYPIKTSQEYLLQFLEERA